MAEELRCGSEGLQHLIDALRDGGHEVFAPQEIDGVIGIAPATRVDELPQGRADLQEPGRYRLARGDGEARFGWAVGPQTWKPVLHPPEVTTVVMRPSRTAAGRDPDIEALGDATDHLALFGVRPCELAAIGRLDTVLGTGDHPDRVYTVRRQGMFIVAVNCTAPAATCFCTSMGTGPRVNGDQTTCDLEVTELGEDPALQDGDPVYVVTAHTDAGRALLDGVRLRGATEPVEPRWRAVETEALERATGEIERQLATEGLPQALIAAREHPVWSEIGDRCLACGNCTAVCPTCFCTSLEDRLELDGTARRDRVWDSCFSAEFSRVGSQPIRSSIRSRYRHWLSHKLSTWHDQFGESGCVGCGRCITWCPVGIDLTVEVPRLREQPLEEVGS